VFGECDGLGCECSNCFVEKEGGVPFDCGAQKDNRTDAVLRKMGSPASHRARSFAKWMVHRGFGPTKRNTLKELVHSRRVLKDSALKVQPRGAWFAPTLAKPSTAALLSKGDSNETDPHLRCDEGPCRECDVCFQAASDKYWSCEEECNEDAYWQCVDEADRMSRDCDVGCEACYECHEEAHAALQAATDPCFEGCNQCNKCYDGSNDCYNSAFSAPACEDSYVCYDKVWKDVCAQASTEEEWAKCDEAQRGCEDLGFRCEQAWRQCDMLTFPCFDQCQECNNCHVSLETPTPCMATEPCKRADKCYHEAWMASTECWVHANSRDEASACDAGYGACDTIACECENCYALQYGYDPMQCSSTPKESGPCGQRLVRARVRAGASSNRMRAHTAWKLRRQYGPVSKRVMAKRLATKQLRKRTPSWLSGIKAQ
jgi:hypothetical protein